MLKRKTFSYARTNSAYTYAKSVRLFTMTDLYKVYRFRYYCSLSTLLLVIIRQDRITPADRYYYTRVWEYCQEKSSFLSKNFFFRNSKTLRQARSECFTAKSNIKTGRVENMTNQFLQA